MPSVMIAEDDLLMADMLEDVLVQNGYDVCGIARTVDQAIELGERHKPDLAVLDIRLAEGGLGTDIAAHLDNPERMGILYASGHVPQIGLTSADGDALISKPYRPADIVRGLKIVEQYIHTGEAPRPFPKGFTLLSSGPDIEALAAEDRSLIEAVRSKIARLNHQRAVFAKFSTFACGKHDITEMMTAAVRACADGLGVPYTKVCRYRAELSDLVVEAGFGWPEEELGSVIDRINEATPQGRVFYTEQPVICNDLRRDTSYVTQPWYAKHNIISTVAVLIETEQGPWGVLESSNTKHQYFDRHDIHYLTEFANTLATRVDAITNKAAADRAICQMEITATEKDRVISGKDEVILAKDRLITSRDDLLAEKSVLAREQQHRVRNHLQLIYGMMSRQLLATTDTEGLRGFGAIARRVLTLAEVYEHLLGTGLNRSVDFGRYLSSLCKTLESIEEPHRPDVELICNCEPVGLDLDTVTSLGLIASELITNSYSHGFDDEHRTSGLINVSLSADQSNGGATMIISDDGTGFADLSDDKRNGLGLVRRLMEQIGGTALLESDHGTKWTLMFPGQSTHSSSSKPNC